MSQIAPDLQELRGTQEAARGIVYTGALSAAIRSPAMWMCGLLLLLVLGSAGGIQGYRLFGIIGALAGATLGAGAATAVW